MHGNVWEWCQDTWHDSYKGAPSNGRAWVDNDNQYRLLRGGFLFNYPIYCRSASRGNDLRRCATSQLGMFSCVLRVGYIK
jgi:formylglycine-generating enzyme required for sulfatase activity